MQKSLTGPTEQRFQAQDEKISTLQAEIDKLAKSQDMLRNDTRTQFGIMEKQHNEQFKSLSTSMNQLQIEVDRSLKMSLQQNTQMMDTKMDELKLLLRGNKKREHQDGEDAAMDF